MIILQTIYIKERKKTNKIKKSIINKYKSLFNKIDILDNNKRILLYLPIIEEHRISKYRIDKISNKVLHIIEKNGTNLVVLTDYLKQNDRLKNNLYNENINILNGRFLFKCLSNNILEYIAECKNIDIKSMEVYILLNDLNNINKDILVKIAREVKILNVVTNNANRFNRVDSYLYKKYGILLNISNNKDLSLLKAKIILNIDFPQELVNKYKICNNAIIINLLERIKIESKRFNGININYYKLRIPEQYKVNEFNDEEIYESIIYNFNYKKVQERLKQDKIKIEGLIGNRGIISKQEFLNNL